MAIEDDVPDGHGGQHQKQGSLDRSCTPLVLQGLTGSVGSTDAASRQQNIKRLRPTERSTSQENSKQTTTQEQEKENMFIIIIHFLQGFWEKYQALFVLRSSIR